MWTIPQETELVATLSAAEIQAFRASADFSDDVVVSILSRTVALVRDYLRSNGGVKLSPDESALPAGCIAHAMDYAAYDLLKRFNLPVSDPRQRARDEAVAYFGAIAEGKLTPESYEDDGTSTKAVSPAYAPAIPERLLD